MITEATASISRTHVFAPRARAGRENWLTKMKSSPRSASASDRKFSWLLRLGVMVLVVGVGAFGVIYYQDQHVDAGPTLVGRQIEGAEGAVKKAPNNLTARLALASAYRSDKRVDDALKQYDEILKADKANRFALLGRGNILLGQGDLKAATAAYRTITSKAVKGEFAGADTQLQEAHYYLGSIAVKQGKTKEALTSLQAALRIDRTDSDALYLMGVAQLKDGKAKSAVDSFKEALRFVPTGWCEPYSQLAVAYGTLAQAPHATYAGGMADFCLKRSAEAKVKLKTLTTSPVAVDALLGLGLIAETESNQAEAASWYKKTLTVDPKNISAISALSRLGVTPTPSKTSPKPKAAGSSSTQGRS
jgi:tetratricopeptide (TPR) repeat protein